MVEFNKGHRVGGTADEILSPQVRVLPRSSEEGRRGSGAAYSHLDERPLERTPDVRG